jgi:hypothetical protein
LRRAVAVGLTLAAAIVALAVAFRPGGTDPTPVDVATAPIPAPAVAPDAGTPATPVADVSVRLRVGPDMPEARLAEVRQAVEAAGFAGVDLTAMPFAIERPRIEFYRPADRAAAEALAAALSPLTAGGLDLRDLGEAAPSAEPRRLDLWLDR